MRAERRILSQSKICQPKICEARMVVLVDKNICLRVINIGTEDQREESRETHTLQIAVYYFERVKVVEAVRHIPQLRYLTVRTSG